MAARLEGYTTTTAVLGGNRVMTVHQWHCYSQPSETYFEFRARIQTTRAEAQAIANGVSAEIEATLAQPTVTDIAWSQDVKPSGQLIGVFTVYWYDAASQSDGWVEIPYTQFNEPNAIEAVASDIAGSTPQSFVIPR